MTGAVKLVRAFDDLMVLQRTGNHCIVFVSLLFAAIGRGGIGGMVSDRRAMPLGGQTGVGVGVGVVGGGSGGLGVGVGGVGGVGRGNRSVSQSRTSPRTVLPTRR